MYSHLDLVVKDMLDSHINFQPLKRFDCMSQIPANQKLMTVAVIHHHCWIRWDSVVISCATLRDSFMTIFGVSVSTKCQGMAFLLHASTLGLLLLGKFLLHYLAVSSFSISACWAFLQFVLLSSGFSVVPATPPHLTPFPLPPSLCLCSVLKAQLSLIEW